MMHLVKPAPAQAQNAIKLYGGRCSDTVSYDFVYRSCAAILSDLVELLAGETKP